MTLTGTVLGTAGYISPEQARGERAGPSSDLYSLAVVAYELLSGHRPYESESPTVEAAAHVNAAVPSIAERHENLSAELDPVFRRALAKDPSSRYASAGELVAALRGALSRAEQPTVLTTSAEPRPRRSIPMSVLVPAALLLLAAAAGAALAAVLTSGGGATTAQIHTRTVTSPAGTTTVQQTVTQQPEPPPPPPPPPVVGSNGHQLNDRGYELQQHGNFAGALPYLQQAVQKLEGTGPDDPYEGYANYNLGYTLYRLGRCSASIPYLKRAEKLEPDRTEPRDIRQAARHC